MKSKGANVLREHWCKNFTEEVRRSSWTQMQLSEHSLMGHLWFLKSTAPLNKECYQDRVLHQPSHSGLITLIQTERRSLLFTSLLVKSHSLFLQVRSSISASQVFAGSSWWNTFCRQKSWVQTLRSSCSSWGGRYWAKCTSWGSAQSSFIYSALQHVFSALPPLQSVSELCGLPLPVLPLLWWMISNRQIVILPFPFPAGTFPNLLRYILVGSVVLMLLFFLYQIISKVYAVHWPTGLLYWVARIAPSPLLSFGCDYSYPTDFQSSCISFRVFKSSSAA